MHDAIKEYLKQGAAEGWTEKTVASYRGRLEHVARFLKAKPCAEVKPGDLLRYLGTLREAGWKREGRRAVCSTLKNFFGWLAGRGKLLANPARSLKIEHDDEVELPAPPLSVAEVAGVLDGLPRRNAIDLRNRAFLELLYGCGLRLSEATGLDLGDVDFSNRVLQVREGKGRKARDLPLGRGVVLALRDYLALRRSMLHGPDHGALFLDRRGRRIHPIHVWQLFKRLNKARGPRAQRLHAHLFRHSIAVHLLQNGADIRYVQQFLGHEKLDTTKIYLRLVPGQLKEDYERAMPEIAVEG